MEGTVTISLQDYQALKSEVDRSNYYFEMAIKHIELFEEVEKFLEIKYGCMDHQKLLTKTQEVLSQWYG